jgi:hypothetical protein
MTIELLKEWDKSQFKTAEKIITKWINSRFFESHHTPNKNPFIEGKSFKAIAGVLGLAYTSTSSFAAYWVCNTVLYLDAEQKYQIDGFAQEKSGFVYAYCMDKDENDLLIPLN